MSHNPVGDPVLSAGTRHEGDPTGATFVQSFKRNQIENVTICGPLTFFEFFMEQLTLRGLSATQCSQPGLENPSDQATLQKRRLWHKLLPPRRMWQ